MYFASLCVFFGSIFNSFVYSYFPFYIGNPPSFWCSHIHMFVNYGINLFWSLCFLFDCFLCSSSFFSTRQKANIYLLCLILHLLCGYFVGWEQKMNASRSRRSFCLVLSSCYRKNHQFQLRRYLTIAASPGVEPTIVNHQYSVNPKNKTTV